MSKEWMQSLPENLQASETLAKYDSTEAALQGLVNMASMQSQMLRVPPEDAGADARADFIANLQKRAPEVMLRPDLSTPEKAAEFWSTLGTPREATEYNNPEGVELEADMLNGIRDMAHKANLTDQQYKTFITQLAEQAGQTAEATASAREQAMGQLKTEWGADYQHREAVAKKTHEMFFKDATGEFDTLDPQAIQSLYDVGKQLGMGAPDSEFNAQPTGEIPVMSPVEAELQIGEILQNKSHPYHNPGDPGHKAAIQKIIELSAYADGVRPTKEMIDAGLTPFKL